MLRGPATRQPIQAHKLYPYLLNGLVINQPNQVWATDITYIPMRKGFMYLVAVMDWFSRYVLSWELSNSLETRFCIQALEEAFKVGEPGIFNSDQGAQFTSEDFTQKTAPTRYSHLHGWQGPSIGQPLCRTLVVECQIRTRVSLCL